MIKLLVGLGNPGPEYESTRHNAGFWWIDAVARALGAHLALERGFHGLVARASVQGRGVWLLQPQTFMNLSGRSVAALGSAGYWRLRLGIGHPGAKSEVVGWVLKKPPLDDRIAIDQAIDRSATALAPLSAGDMAQATLLIHTAKPPRPKPPRPAVATPATASAGPPADPSAG